MSAHKPIPRSKLQTAFTYTYYDLMIYCNEVLKFKRKKTRFQIWAKKRPEHREKF